MKSSNQQACHHELCAERPPMDPHAIDRAARLFRALGDGPRLTILTYLSHGECCVSELVQVLGEKFSTVSQRLRLLRSEGLIRRRRVASHVYYQLADGHVQQLLKNALDHSLELNQNSIPMEDDE